MAGLLLALIYLSFISLGLPDALLGAAWPEIYPEFQVPVSYAGIISMIIALGTIVSSLQSDRLTRKFGAGVVTAVSVGITAAALFGAMLMRMYMRYAERHGWKTVSHSFWALCLWAIPYGLGAGSVDASLNNYVALHYASKHMSWLHCMWGVGATLGPYIMGLALTHGAAWNSGYRIIFGIQVVLTAILVFSLPKWKKSPAATQTGGRALSLREIVRIPGAKAVMLCFLCYCAIEQTAMLWASSYLTLAKGVPAQTAAQFASLFCIGITVGRGLNGFAAMKLKDRQMVRMGEGIVLLGVAVMLLPFGKALSLAGFLLIGFGCAPVYPCLIHGTPEHFGAERSQAVIGVQMASAYVGNLTMPPLFGLLANNITPALFPFYLLALLVLMVCMHEQLVRKTRRS